MYTIHIIYESDGIFTRGDGVKMDLKPLTNLFLMFCAPLHTLLNEYKLSK